MQTSPIDDVLGSAAIAGLLLAVPRHVARLWQAWHNRCGVTHMRALDERTLADIGLSRLDLEAALAQPFDRDPSELLIQRRAERHRTPRR